MNAGHQPDTVRGYLDTLQAALKGRPPALIRDALTDAEEHLRNEIIQHPAQDEHEVLANAIETYGTPQEVAETYQTMEAAWSGPSRKRPGANADSFQSSRSACLQRACLYASVACHRHFYFVWTITGLMLSVGLFVLIIGVPFALLFIGSERVIAHVEGRIIETLLGVRMPRRLPPEYPEYRNFLSRIGEALTDVRTWSSIFYLLLMLPLGIVYFVIAASLRFRWV